MRIYNYLCNQWLSPLILWVRISIRARCKTLCDKVCQWLATAQWFYPGTQVSSTNNTDHHDITEILLKVALNTIKQIVFFLCVWYRYFAGMICGIQKQHSSLRSDSTPNITTTWHSGFWRKSWKPGKGVGRVTENTTLFLLAYYEQNAD